MVLHAAQARWFEIANAAEIPSPALLIYRDRVEANLREMLRIAGTPTRLRPHIKTHKLPELVRRQVELGITKFKCATIAEAEMAARNGAANILLAYQPVGPHAQRLVNLAAAFPARRIACLADDAGAIRALAAARAACATTVAVEIFLDLDIGQHRTGVAPGPQAVELVKLITSLPQLKFAGLHAYDGHISDSDPAQRAAQCDAAFAPLLALRRTLAAAGLPVPTIIAGGSPTFPIHARRSEPGLELSPGTAVFWDASYHTKLPDLAFLPAAVLLTRVVSKPGAGRLCLDLGYKAVASEMPPPRVVFLDLPEATPLLHSEEHLVIAVPHAERRAVGDCCYCLPWHVCPTVALHDEVWVVEHGRAVDRWTITARARRLAI